MAASSELRRYSDDCIHWHYYKPAWWLDKASGGRDIQGVDILRLVVDIQGSLRRGVVPGTHFCLVSKSCCCTLLSWADSFRRWCKFIPTYFFPCLLTEPTAYQL